LQLGSVTDAYIFGHRETKDQVDDLNMLVKEDFNSKGVKEGGLVPQIKKLRKNSSADMMTKPNLIKNGTNIDIDIDKDKIFAPNVIIQLKKIKRTVSS
jgi:hypothetical protein